MATLSTINLSATIPRFTPATGSRDTAPVILRAHQHQRATSFPGLAAVVVLGRRRVMTTMRSAGPDQQLSEKVADSVKQAEESCSDDPKSGECVAAWDEVEELSAAASHARDRKKENSDPLETYCKDNPETDECRTYDN